MPTILQTIAQDLNRSLLHGARRKGADGKVLPSTVFDGRQAASTPEQIAGGVQVLAGGNTATLTPDKNSAANTNDAATAVFNAPATYLKLDPEQQIPRWIHHQKSFSLPSKPVPEDCLAIDSQRMLVRIPPAVLQEAESDFINPASTASVSLCILDTRIVANASRQVLTPVAPLDGNKNTIWNFALFLRCPVQSAWASDETSHVFEVSGIPQAERWYLDQLGLLRDLGAGVPVNSSLQLWLQPPGTDSTPGVPIKVQNWIIARRNLTGLARPGASVAMAATPHDTYPYVADQTDVASTLRLLQMASITNSGGYYIQFYDQALSGINPGNYTLIITLQLPTEGGNYNLGPLPLRNYANAVVFPPTVQGADGQAKEPSILRVEGLKHIVIDAYAPPGCVAFGWRRTLPAVTGAGQPTPDTKEGFARSIHLLDFESKDGNGNLLTRYVEKIQWDDTGTKRSSTWISEPCSGDTGPALSPVKPMQGQTDGNQYIAALAMDQPPDDNAEDDDNDNQTPPASYYYRTTVRFATVESGFAYLQDPKTRQVVSVAAHRDIFGNRLFRAQGIQNVNLYYTDRLIPIGEWPGFVFSIFPAGALMPGVVTVQARYAPPTQIGGDDLKRKLNLIKAQLTGTGADVTVTIADVSGLDDGAANYTFVPKDGDLKQGLLRLIQNILDGTLPSDPSAKANFTVHTTLTNAPQVFEPYLLISRTDTTLLPQPADLPIDSAVSDAIRQQVFTSRAPLTLGPASTVIKDSDSGNQFKATASQFAQLVGASINCEAAIRRNRFGDLELWFVPRGLFPSVATGAPSYYSLRPLSTRLGAGTFQVPQFPTDPATGGQPALAPVSVANIDYDLLCRRVIAMLENLFQPAAITSNVQIAANTYLWDAILQARDDLGKLLGSKDGGYVVPTFVNAPSVAANLAGLERMCQDALARDLNLFYGVDSLVQWPINLPTPKPSTNSITNLYGLTTAAFGTSQSATPSYSDFVINVKQDAGQGGNPSTLTLTYSLPPGQEGSWANWPTSNLVATITHVQLPIPGEPDNFNAGQWLEIVRTDDDKTCVLGFGSSSAVPVIERLFPETPVLKSAIAAPSLVPAAGNLAFWGWRVVFNTEDNGDDTVYLDVAYNNPEENPQPSVAPQDAAPQSSWPPTSVLQDLVVLDSLSSRSSDWWKSRAGAQALTMLPQLLTLLGQHLRPKIGAADVSMIPQVDHFSINAGDPSHRKSDPNNWVQIIDVQKAATLTPKIAQYTITANADGKLALFGANAAHNFQPSLHLKRNDDLARGLTTTQSLVYECGPVLFPDAVRAANRWPSPVPVATTGQQSLDSAIASALSAILGPDTKLADYDTRVDMKFAFSLLAANAKLSNHFALYPADFPYPSLQVFSTALAKAYQTWINTTPITKTAAPALRLGIQITRRQSDGHPSRVLLDIDALEFDLTKLTTT
jgi:hypothetical protein